MQRRRRILWLNVSTVLSAAVLIGAIVFAMAYGGGWAADQLLGLGSQLTMTLQGLLMLGAAAGVAVFIRVAAAQEPFTSD